MDLARKTCNNVLRSEDVLQDSNCVQIIHAAFNVIMKSSLITLVTMITCIDVKIRAAEKSHPNV